MRLCLRLITGLKICSGLRKPLCACTIDQALVTSRKDIDGIRAAYLNALRLAQNAAQTAESYASAQVPALCFAILSQGRFGDLKQLKNSSKAGAAPRQHPGSHVQQSTKLGIPHPSKRAISSNRSTCGCNSCARMWQNGLAARTLENFRTHRSCTVGLGR